MRIFRYQKLLLKVAIAITLIFLVTSSSGSYFLSRQNGLKHDISSNNENKEENYFDMDSNFTYTSYKNFLEIGQLTEDEINVTKFGDTFEGLNIFVLNKHNLISLLYEAFLVVIDMSGKIVSSRFLGTARSVPYSVAKFINSTTVIVGGISKPFLWNFYQNTTKQLNFKGHHDYEYNSNSNTLFTSKLTLVEIEEENYFFDEILEYDFQGNLVWSLSTSSFVSPTQWCPYNDMIQDKKSLTHTNSIFYDCDEDVIYINCRNLNTFYKINHTSKEVIWGIGEYGDFTLLDQHGNQRDNLFFHAHAVEKIDDSTFILFDNDFHNQTDPSSDHSRAIEISINEQTMTANISWEWEAPSTYYSNIWGDADRLMNGNRLITFGTIYNSDPLYSARIIEVNTTGQIVWEMNFPKNGPFRYGLYRVERFCTSPILESHFDSEFYSENDVVAQWKTWFNSRLNYNIEGNYSLYLDSILVDEGTHLFTKFWQNSLIEYNLGKLTPSNYNLTLKMSDASAHTITDSVMIRVEPYYIQRYGASSIEKDQRDTNITWIGETTNPLDVDLIIDDISQLSSSWNGSDIVFDLNTLILGEHLVSLLLYNNSELIFNDTFNVHIFPLEIPNIQLYEKTTIMQWGEPTIFRWIIVDNTPSQWSVLINETVYTTKEWSSKIQEIYWSIPLLDEGKYNITLIAFDRAGLTNVSSIWLTIIEPSPPKIASTPQQTDFQFGIGNISFSWEIHGGTSFKLFNDGKQIFTGQKDNHFVDISFSNWESGNWWPGKHNITLFVQDEKGKTAISSVWVNIWLNKGDKYADFIIDYESELFQEGENALGAPDGINALIYLGYANGYIAFDMGFQEEILNRNGNDFTVYAKGGIYLAWIKNDLDSSFVYLGQASGIHSFDLSDKGFNKARYVRIEYAFDEYIELDAIEAIYVNQPTWDDQPPTIEEIDDFWVWDREKKIQLSWNVSDTNPLNFSIMVNNSNLKSGLWDGSSVNCSIPIDVKGQYNVTITLFDVFRNKAEFTVLIEVKPFSIYIWKNVSYSVVGLLCISTLFFIVKKYLLKKSI